MHSSWYYPLIVSREILLFPPALSAESEPAQESHPGSCCYTTAFRETSPPQPQPLRVSVTWLLRSGQIEFNNASFFTILGAVCSDMRRGNWLDLNICIPSLMCQQNLVTHCYPLTTGAANSKHMAVNLIAVSERGKRSLCQPPSRHGAADILYGKLLEAPFL